MKVVRESLLEEVVTRKDDSLEKIELVAGLVIIQKGSILVVHPKGYPWYGTYSIPKGHIKKGEKILDAAIRETREETDIVIDKYDIIDPTPKYIDFKDKQGNTYKRLYYFIVNPKEPIPNDAVNVDGEENDWAGFIKKDRAKVRLFWKQKIVLDQIDNIEEIEKAREEAKQKKEDDKKDES